MGSPAELCFTQEKWSPCVILRGLDKFQERDPSIIVLHLDCIYHSVKCSPNPMAATAHASPAINTYHCLCSHLLLATTHDIGQLPLRKGESLDHAHILPSPPVPERIRSSILADARRSPSPALSDDGTAKTDGVTVLLSIMHASQPVIIRRNDGIEKRYLLQCSRCKLTVAYYLDWAQWEKAGQAVSRKGKREDVIFVLPGAVMSSDEMLQMRRTEGG